MNQTGIEGKKLRHCFADGMNMGFNRLDITANHRACQCLMNPYPVDISKGAFDEGF